MRYILIDYLHEKEEDVEDPKTSNIPTEERQLRERLRLTIGELKTSSSKDQGVTDNMYWSTDDNLRKLLRFRPSIKEMELIQRPMCYLPKPKRMQINQNEEYEKDLERQRYFVTLQKNLIEYFLLKHSTKTSTERN